MTNTTLDFTYTNVHNKPCIQRLELSSNGDGSYQLFVNDGHLRFDACLTKKTIEALVEALRSSKMLTSQIIKFDVYGTINVVHHKTVTMIKLNVPDDCGMIYSELILTHENVQQLIAALIGQGN